MNAGDAFSLVAAGLAGAAVCAVATPLAARLSTALAVLDRPSGYKAHGAATPLFGGVAVALGSFAGAALAFSGGPRSGELAWLAVGAVVIVVAGLVDDTRGMSPGRKLAWQIAAIALAGSGLALAGVRLSLFLDWPAFPMVLITVLWIVAITNAVNFLDNMNGLCAGLGAIGAGALSVINWRNGEIEVAATAAALAGACLGFLPYNWPRARIFLGDTGSMLIGFLLASLSVMGVYTREATVPELAVLSPLLVLAIPIMDLVIVLLLRWRIRHPPWVGDRRHLSHRLVRRGLSPAVAVAVLWAAAAIAAVGAIVLPTVEPAIAPLWLAGVVLALAMLAGAAGARGLDD